MTELKESEIQKIMLDFLRLKGFMAWKNVSTGIAGGGKDKTRFYSMGMKGISDITALKDNTILFIEVKRKGGKPTEHQKKFLQDVKSHGAIGIIAYDLDDIIKVTEKYSL